MPPTPDSAFPADFRIGGFQPFSLCDWPGRIAATLFTQGCALRCGYCHNPHLIARDGSVLDNVQVLRALHARRGLIDGVVFSGGEPCLQPGLAAAMETVGTFGFEVGLHSAGTHPRALRAVLPRVSWLGLDIKAPTGHLRAITGANCDRRVAESLAIAVASGVDLEVRTTWSPALFSAEELCDLVRALKAQGVTKFVLQRLREYSPRRDGKPHWLNAVSPPAALLEQMRGLFSDFELR
ncbi:MAG: anaerobic ribonucleoside-triphosphate reductase activating protein [Betaproteobacteria bacterium]|nr:anaerobic ribonucleoside-triphosphate reductase activating protein [Betaproteobacteria bacterium]